MTAMPPGAHHSTLVNAIRKAGLLEEGSFQFEPMAGGVSSDISLVRQGNRAFVVKQALAQLRVREEWFADCGRNLTEQAYIQYVHQILPDAVPAILYTDAGQGFFVMEYLGDGFENWKALLMAGGINPRDALETGRILGEIHRHSWQDEAAARQFETTRNFRQLRTNPYLLTTGARHPGLRGYFEEEVERLEATRLCLVHGDFSPKNILIRQSRVVLLDCEVAWFGDPVFDVAFLLNHLALKALRFPARAAGYLSLAGAFWESYSRALGPALAAGIEPRVPGLLLMLMLARVDGKSPAEYLTGEPGKQAIRNFVQTHLPSPPPTLAALWPKWEQAIHQTANPVDHEN